MELGLDINCLCLQNLTNNPLSKETFTFLPSPDARKPTAEKFNQSKIFILRVTRGMGFFELTDLVGCP
jgi:hypothetical protein